MKAEAQGICSLCQREFPRAEILDRIHSEHPSLRQSTIKLIQASCTGWDEQQDICLPCWKAYRDATQVLQLLKASHARFHQGTPL